MQRTLILLKPDAVGRGLVGRILARFEDKGLKIVALKLTRVSETLARTHYGAHEGKDFYEPLLAFITAGPIVAAVLEGVGAIDACRKMMGATFGPDAEAGTIRGDWGMSKRYNLIHGSDSPEAAAREIELFFSDEELLDYDRPGDKWTYAEHRGELI
jgi:nucleoside-diphosphate kinase